MKNLKTLFVLFVSIITVSFAFTSCNTDGEDYSITLDVQRQYMQQMAGMYPGKVVVNQPNASGNKYVAVDSVYTSWTVNTDSTLVIHNFPINMLDSAVNVSKGEISTEATQLRELRTAISQLSPEDIRCAYYIPSSQFVSSVGYQFVVNPLCVNSDFYTLKSTGQSMFIKKTLSYGGTTHDVYFVFYLNYYGGAFSTTNRTFQFNMALAAISIDKKPVDYYSNSFASTYFRPLVFTCVKSN